MGNHLHYSRTKYFGIMVCAAEGAPPFADSLLYRNLCLSAERLGLQAFVFSPAQLDWQTWRVDGYTYSKRHERWAEARFPFPDIVYDRCFANDRLDYVLYKRTIHRLKSCRHVQILGNGLQGKWNVQQALFTEPSLRPHLPRTAVLSDDSTFIAQLCDKRAIFLKPQAGSQGKGALHISEDDFGQIAVHGRDHYNQPFDKRFADRFALLQWMKSFIAHRKYLIQDYLSLTTTDGISYDVRSLAQKNGSGNWQITGMAVRRGQPGSVTSNLHGGGAAEELTPFLRDQFGDVSAQRIIETMRTLSHQIPCVLETHYGRLAELGIDYGVDRTGHVWILEVNSKPGRSVFRRLSDEKATFHSVYNPIHYARYLLELQLGG